MPAAPYRGAVSRPSSAGEVQRPPTTVDEALEVLRAHGGRATASRRVLLEVLFESTDHRSAEDLAAAVQDRAPDVHLSTVYRNLEELQRLGVVVHTHLGHGPATYQPTGRAHAHLICEACGTTIEAADDLFRGLARSALARHGFVVDPRHFAILGRCASCAAGDTAGAGAVASPDQAADLPKGAATPR